MMLGSPAAPEDELHAFSGIAGRLQIDSLHLAAEKFR
jgi:hypothetical protein